MVETLTLMPMAPGTRSRRADVPRRPAPVLLPKQNQSSLGRQQSQRPTRPPQPPPQQPTPPSPQLPRSPYLSTASATRSIQDILNHANSMRPKRKADPSSDDANTNANANSSADDATTGSRPDFDPAQHKRPRLSVEIVSRPVLGGPTVSALSAPTTALANPALPPKKSLRTLPSAEATPNTATSTATNNGTFSAVAPNCSSTTPRTSSKRNRSRDAHGTIPHRHVGRPPSKNTSQLAARPKEKAANGFKQELKGLQVTAEAAVAAATGPPEGGRKLRSQQATRFKSDLAAYFPEYDEVIGNEPKEEHILNIDTPIFLIESHYPTTAGAAGAVVLPDKPAGSLPSGSGPGTGPDTITVQGYSDSLFYDLFDSHVLDFGFLGNQQKGRNVDDPLPDSVFEPHHKRAERLERSIRNSEKGRAQHEKDQIIRLLEGLQGHDWLRTMGVSGITESKKKSFEPAREHFIKGCRTILKKFRLWSLEEKRLKLKKDRAHAEEVRAQEVADGEPPRYKGRGKGKAKAAARHHAATAVLERPDGRRRRDRVRVRDRDCGSMDAEDSGTHEEAEEADDAVEEPEEPERLVHGDGNDAFDSGDADAVIAKQLRVEALAQSKMAAKGNPPGKRRKKLRSPSSDCQHRPDAKEAEVTLEEIKSFFRKRYQREAALSRSRRKNRTIMAWGQPVPEPVEADFDLPEEILHDLGDPRGPPARRKRKGKQEES